MDEQEKGKKTAYISFNAGIDQKNVQTLIAVLFEQIRLGFGHLYILFSTTGGQINDGITLYNTLRSMPATVTMHNMGNIDSVGNIIFLAGEHRYACPSSTFMFHGAAHHYTDPHELDEIATREVLESIVASQKRMGAIIARHTTSLPAVDIAKLFAEAQTKDTDFAIKVGIVHAVRDIKIPDGATIIPLVF